jgi:bacillithiol system protein YtxJ
MNWIALTAEDQLDNIILKSGKNPQVIFKHSTRCSISSVALNRFQKVDNPDQIDFYLLDLIAYRSVSNKIAEVFQVHHESPQVLMIVNGECIYDETHLAISPEDLLDQVPAN